jgi:beta-lactamase regulating signal transducer with metallopeptidase domain
VIQMSVETFNSWSMSTTGVAVAILWQSAVLAAIVGGVCWLLKRASPAVRYWCWQIVALKLLLMPWWILAVPLPAFFTETPSAAAGMPASNAIDGAAPSMLPSRTTTPLEQPSGQAPGSVTEPSHRFFWISRLSWHSWLVIAWLLGAAYLAGRIVIQRRRMQRLLDRASPAAEPRLLAMVDGAAAQLGLRRTPIVLFTDQDVSPFVCGMFRPVLVLPRSLTSTLDAIGWRQVLLHELAHIKRRDLWWGWLPEIARLIYFFHPVAHWVCSRIRLERELACDQLAMALSGTRAAEYAVVLVQVVSHASTPPALQTAAASLLGLDAAMPTQQECHQ